MYAIQMSGGVKDLWKCCWCGKTASQERLGSPEHGSFGPKDLTEPPKEGCTA